MARPSTEFAADEEVQFTNDVEPLDEGPNLSLALRADSFHLRIPSRPEWIVPTVEYLTERFLRWEACFRDRISNVTLALHEALTNSIIHGGLELSSEMKDEDNGSFAEALAARAADPHLSARAVDIHATFDGVSCRWAFTDQGKGFDVDQTLARIHADDVDVYSASGRGIMLMQAIMDEVHYSAQGRRVELVLQGTGVEKREHPRLPAGDRVHVAPIGPDGKVDWREAYPASARDVSAGGIRLLQTRLTSSPRVLIGLDWEGELLYVPAELRHCELLGEGMMQLGCRFHGAEGLLAPSDKVSGQDVEAAIGSVLSRLDGDEEVHHERRAHHRVVYTERIGISGGPGPAVGFARNLSKGGISFLVYEPMPLECRILSLPGPDGQSLQVRARIVRCKPLTQNVFDVGAHFEAIGD